MAVRDIGNLINNICKASLPQDVVKWEARQKLLRWRWYNERTAQEWILRLSEVKRMGWLDTSDPRNAIKLAFLYGKQTAFEAKHNIEHLDKLKAFW